MIRLYDEFANKVLTFLTLLRVGGGRGDIQQTQAATDIRAYDPGRWGRGTGVAEIAVGEIDMVTRFGNNRTTLDEVINELAEQMSQRRDLGTKGEQTLVDAMIDTLRLDTVQPILGARTIQALRQALLKPNELAQAEHRLRTRTLSCSNCQRDITSGEGITVGFSENGESLIYCHPCNWPKHVKCAKMDCEEPVYVTDGSQFHKEHYCEAHRQVSTDKTKKQMKIAPARVGPGGRRQGLGQMFAPTPPELAFAQVEEQMRALDRRMRIAWDVETPGALLVRPPDPGEV